MAHEYVPYKTVSSWRCLRCGRCCIEYSVPLMLNEALRLIKKYGWVIERRGNKVVLASKPNGECIFLSRIGGLAYCTIYYERPLVCKLYPFYIRLKPLDETHRDKALYICEDNLKLYVYIDRKCPGVDRGGYPIEIIVPKIVKVWREALGI